VRVLLQTETSIFSIDIGEDVDELAEVVGIGVDCWPRRLVAWPIPRRNKVAEGRYFLSHYSPPRVPEERVAVVWISLEEACHGHLRNEWEMVSAVQPPPFVNLQ
jgi:hypothetical protein